MTHTEYMREYTRKNRDRINAWRKERYAIRKEEINQKRRERWKRTSKVRCQVQNDYKKRNLEKVSQWPSVSKEKTREYAKAFRKRSPVLVRAIQRRHQAKKKSTNPEFKLLCNLRSRVSTLIRREWKTGRTIELLGCSVKDFKIYLESRFKSGMTWDNYGKKWHIDHIVPCALFDLTKPEQQRYCFHFSNMRPMWAKENISRGIRGHHQLHFPA